MAGSAWTNQVVNKVIVGGVNGGIFLYNGTPKLGNPPIDWITKASTDPYGNTLPATDFVAIHYAAVNSWAQMTDGEFALGGSNFSTPATWQLDLTGAPSQPAAVLKSPASVTNTLQALLEMYPSATAPFLASDTVNAWQPGQRGITAESWHAASMAAGFTGTSGGDQAVRYMIDANGFVRLDGVVFTSAATLAGATMFTLPAAYSPLKRKRFGGCATNFSGHTVVGSSNFQVNTNGTVVASDATSGAGQQLALEGTNFAVN